MKGVWHHPEFHRSRAVECLKLALETGDTGSFNLTMNHSKVDGECKGEDEDKKEPSSQQDSQTTQSASLSGSFAMPSGDQIGSLDDSQRAANDLPMSALVPGQNVGFLPSDQITTRAFKGPSGSLTNSFTAGVHNFQSSGQKRGASISLSAAPAQNYQPDVQPSNKRQFAASWTAGYAQQNFNFATIPNFSSDTDYFSMQGNQNPNQTFDTWANDNVDRIAGMAFTGGYNSGRNGSQPSNRGEKIPEENAQDKMAPEDFELARFFGKFADSLEK